VSRRPAAITQADVARAIRAAKQAGAAEVEIRSADGSKIVIRIASSTSDATTLEPAMEIVRQRISDACIIMSAGPFWKPRRLSDPNSLKRRMY
jgi:uncharacterized protein (DUF849 family)